MLIRQLTLDDYDQHMDLAQYAFQFSMTPEEQATRKEKFTPGRSWGAFVEDKLAAKLTILPFELYLYGRKLRMGGLASVSTWPEERRQGYVKELLQHSLAVMKEAGQTVSCLAPFSFPFYRKYGWELYVEYKKYTIETAQLPPRAAYEGRVERTDGDLSQLAPVYEAYAARYNGTLIRDEAWWTESVFRRKPRYTAVYSNADGEPRGYILYDIGDRKLTVHEMVYLEESGREALWTFIANHDSMIDKVEIEVPMDDNLPYLLPNPRVKQEIFPYFMARIVDAPAFVSQLALNPAGDGPSQVTVQITDPFAPWNEGAWTLRVDEEGRAALLPGGAAEDGTTELGCTIQALTAMLMGYARPLRLYGYGQLAGSVAAAQRVEQWIPNRQTNLLDFF
ncbi:putative acetyltransferase [Paenibacillus phyllosphaerae]|uniref:Putative acetyltransferase n=1 Tax=Paenibacillus phyllosphaerae TaxID=274593 RepID=A0A7W5AXL9_9BACL|nr:GNAT family N-acetyltransferase [Paenibacillus phyllosphaerae]MBB3110660.1 putative acetyltransferase [Paenibacillus phyllosphaerae]